MLLDRGLLVEKEGVYRFTGEVAELEVPETLQGLIAARLDGLAADERRLLQDAAVLGKTFTKESLAALSGLSEAELEPLLAGLVRKEVLGVQADPRSPERGQYGSSRTSSAASPTRRWPAATEEPPSRRRRPGRGELRRRRAGDRRGRGRPLRRRLRGPARCRRRGRHQVEGP